ncbi:hypothetical protein SDC9_81605 [bioreactor metagenome]|uniref:Uncharacterized protein n=1 Tax=bioreactor metagenome TaxID=1076179 RepID=A0A644Z289_9ZZZZ
MLTSFKIIPVIIPIIKPVTTLTTARYGCSGKAYSIETITIGLTADDDNQKVIVCGSGVSFFKSPDIIGTIPQSHIGIKNPATAAIKNEYHLPFDICFIIHPVDANI